MDRQLTERPDGLGWAVYRFGTSAMSARGQDALLLIVGILSSRMLYVVTSHARAPSEPTSRQTLDLSFSSDQRQTTRAAVAFPYKEY